MYVCQGRLNDNYIVVFYVLARPEEFRQECIKDERIFNIVALSMYPWFCFFSASFWSSAQNYTGDDFTERFRRVDGGDDDEDDDEDEGDDEDDADVDGENDDDDDEHRDGDDRYLLLSI